MPLVPTWTEDLWNDIKGRELTSKGGWSYPDQIGYLIVINRDDWSMDFEPVPAPPPPNAYLMGEDDWNRIANGTLLSNNCIQRNSSYQVEAHSGDPNTAVVNTCSQR